MTTLRILKIAKGVLAAVSMTFMALLLPTILSGFTLMLSAADEDSDEDYCQVCIECDPEEHGWAMSCCIGFDFCIAVDDWIICDGWDYYC